MVYKGGGCALPDWTTSCQLIVFLIPRLSSSSMATSTWSEAPPSQILILSISMKVQLLDNQKCPIRRWVKFLFSFGFEAYSLIYDDQHQISRYLPISLLRVLTMIQIGPQASQVLIFIIDKQVLMYL